MNHNRNIVMMLALLACLCMLTATAATSPLSRLKIAPSVAPRALSFTASPTSTCSGYTDLTITGFDNPRVLTYGIAIEFPSLPHHSLELVRLVTNNNSLHGFAVNESYMQITDINTVTFPTLENSTELTLTARVHHLGNVPNVPIPMRAKIRSEAGVTQVATISVVPAPCLANDMMIELGPTQYVATYQFWLTLRDLSVPIKQGDSLELTTSGPVRWQSTSHFPGVCTVQGVDIPASITDNGSIVLQFDKTVSQSSWTIECPFVNFIVASVIVPNLIPEYGIQATLHQQGQTSLSPIVGIVLNSPS